MDNNNWRAARGQKALGPPQGQVGGGEVSAVPSVAPPAAMDAVDWRTHFQADHRQSIVNKIMDTLKRHIPSSGPEGLEDLKKIAIMFEEKIHTAATSQMDYLRKISSKMLTMEIKSQNPMTSSAQSNAGKNPPDQGGSAHNLAPVDSSEKRKEPLEVELLEDPPSKKIKPSVVTPQLTYFVEAHAKRAAKLLEDEAQKFFNDQLASASFLAEQVQKQAKEIESLKAEIRQGQDREISLNSELASVRMQLEEQSQVQKVIVNKWCELCLSGTKS